MPMVQLVYLIYGYVLLGSVFGLYFIGWGAARLDAEAGHMPVTLRLLLLPASVALWPLLLTALITPKR